MKNILWGLVIVPYLAVGGPFDPASSEIPDKPSLQSMKRAAGCTLFSQFVGGIGSLFGNHDQDSLATSRVSHVAREMKNLPPEMQVNMLAEIKDCGLAAQFAYAVAVYPGNHQAARNYFGRAAKKGYSEAQFRYGGMLKNGDGGPQDLEGALRQFRSCEKKGDSRCYDLVREVEKLMEESKPWSERTERF